MSEKTRIRRLPERGVEDREKINEILDEGLVCHAAYVIEDRPVVIPTLYVRSGDRLLLHGSATSGLVKAVRDGSPLSVGVTHIDGLVVARSGFHSSANYRSVVVHGQGRLLSGEEKEKALDVIVDSLIPGRVLDIRRPTASEIKQTAVIELSLDEVSAKVRSGGPDDDPADLMSDAWAGVVPFTVVAGEAEPSADLRHGIPTPDYLQPYGRQP
jgi:nitroimidazol reductase NimA-like FMN-containing flavoprotein (pyridoxamine 5'-phosphate oxidase superfamily)